MCGIAGVLDPRRPDPDALLGAARRMADAVQHRGPDDAGAWCQSTVGLAFGHRRLSIIDLSPAGHQPMMSACERYMLSYNGEIYNHRDLRADLEREGVTTWRGHSDTEVLLAGMTRWGIDATLERANGMFAIAVWDAAERTVVLARDRLGEKPLYYGWAGPVLVFGSELKALRAHPDWSAEIDRGAAALFLRYGYVPAPFSIYRGVRKLPAASVLRLRTESLTRGTLPEPRTYWSAREAAERGMAEPLRVSTEEATEQLDVLLRDAVRIRMAADVPLGAFLSGGTDSSTIVALMQSQSPRPVRTFTIGFPEPGYDEAAQARAVANALHTNHTELYVTPEEAREVIPRLPAMYDEPFADSSQIPTFLVSQMARRHVTVALSGDGGDELFGGYVRYSAGRRLWKTARWMPRSLRNLTARALGAPNGSGRGGARDAASWWLPAAFRESQAGKRVQKVARVLTAGGADDMYLQLVSHWSSPNELVIGGTEPTTVATDRGVWPHIDDVSDRMMYLDQQTYLPDDILVKVDRASMAVSLEARVPFLDHRVVEFAWRVPLALKLRDGTGKWILKEVLHRYLPAPLLNHPKLGFGVPLGAWLRGPLRPWAEELLSEGRLKELGVLQTAPVRRAWEEHLSGRFDREQLLWTVLTLQAWLASAET
jgi:asparagine synthase (glutamine-hydrolysing)